MTASNQIILSGLSAADLVELFRPMVKDEIQKLKADQPERLLSPAETCKLFNPKISKVTLATWTAAGKLQDHRMGSRVYYLESGVLAKCITLKKYKNHG